MKENPFIYSDSNKRYYTWNYYLKQTYHQKVCKVPLDAHFTCPNRDGTKGSGGCSFCSSKGSGDFTYQANDLFLQFQKGKEMMHRKWPNALCMAYFQAYSNTYASLDTLKKIYEPFVDYDECMGIVIATRSDCLNEENVAYIASIKERKDVWVELGLQTIHNKFDLNRKETLEDFEKAITSLRKYDIPVAVHIINSLPYETKEDMLETAKYLATKNIQALKIHMLFISKNTKLASIYQENPFPLLSKEEYVELVVKQLELLPPHMIIERLTGDGVKEDVIAPLWSLNKTTILNDIDKLMAKLDTYQGKYYLK